MLIGAHSVMYSTQPQADRAFLRDVLKLKSVDAGGGYMILSLPPAELSVHEEAEAGMHELFLMCDDIEKFVHEIQKHDALCDAVTDEGWGLLCRVHLPSGARLGVYQPKHTRPNAGS